ncbi:MAG: hypothetical protein WCW66_05055 [Patescibacteria group bacterium]
MGEIVKLFPSGSDDSEKGGGLKFDQRLNAENITLMLEFLTALTRGDRSALHQPNIEIRRSLVAVATNEELLAIANQSNESDWQEHPSYYHALIAELRERRLIG